MYEIFTRAQARIRWWVATGLFALALCHVMAQAPVDPNFDPSDVYFQAYLDVRAAEQLEKDGDYLGALKKYQQAGKLFDSVGKFFPEWKSSMVTNRRELTTKSIEVVRGKAGEQFKREKGVIAELEGGVKVGARPEKESVNPELPRRGILEVEPLAARRLKEAEAELARLRAMSSGAEASRNEAMRNAARLQEMERKNEELARQLKEAEANAGAKEAQAEVERLKKLISQADATSNEAMRNAARVEDLRKKNDTLSRQLKAAEANVLSMRAQLAAAPVASEMDALNKQIEKLEQEREVMGLALRTSRGQQSEALSKIEILTADIDVMKKQTKELRQSEANLNRNLEKERHVANDVVKGQRKQMEALEKALAKKSKELEKALGQIASLRKELEESRDAFDDLREERDGLLLERDQMAALLKLRESDRTQELIEQNMGLAKDLREANEKVERLYKDNNAAKDDIVDALRDLAIAKSQINRLQQENREQTKRLAELTEKLKGEEVALAKGEVNADPAEVEMLREVIRRQLRFQEHRRQAKEVIVEATKQLAKEDEALNDAIELFAGKELALTPEEQKLVADQQVDGEFISPFARNRAAVGRSTSDLNREMESYDRAATKAYLAGRLLPTRELFELMVEQNPGHLPSLCKLGVVQLKLEEPQAAIECFTRAVELENNNPYAHRMLGYAHLKVENFTAAKRHLKYCVDLSPSDIKGYLLLGTIAYRQGNMGEAEANFKSAITVDPVASESYFNLALIYSKSGRLEKARKFYKKALERGALPDPQLEMKLAATQ